MKKKIPIKPKRRRILITKSSVSAVFSVGMKPRRGRYRRRAPRVSHPSWWKPYQRSELVL